MIVLGVIAGLAVAGSGIFCVCALTEWLANFLLWRENRWWSFPLFVTFIVTVTAPLLLAAAAAGFLVSGLKP